MDLAAGSADSAPGSEAAVRVSDIVRDVVAQAAPDELPLVEGLSRLDAEVVMRRLSRGSRPREPLGFGLDEVAVLVSPVLWMAIEEVVRRIVGSAVDGGAKGWKTLLRKVTRRRAAVLTVPALTPEQIAEVQKRVLELAAQRGVEPDRAALLTELLGARLALPAVEESTRASHDEAVGGNPSGGTGSAG